MICNACLQCLLSVKVILFYLYIAKHTEHGDLCDQKALTAGQYTSHAMHLYMKGGQVDCL